MVHLQDLVLEWIHQKSQLSVTHHHIIILITGWLNFSIKVLLHDLICLESASYRWERRMLSILRQFICVIHGHNTPQYVLITIILLVPPSTSTVSDMLRTTGFGLQRMEGVTLQRRCYTAPRRSPQTPSCYGAGFPTGVCSQLMALCLSQILLRSTLGKVDHWGRMEGSTETSICKKDSRVE